MAQDGTHRLTLVPSLISWSWVMHFLIREMMCLPGPSNLRVVCGVNVFRRNDDDRADSWEAGQ